MKDFTQKLINTQSLLLLFLIIILNSAVASDKKGDALPPAKVTLSYLKAISSMLNDQNPKTDRDALIVLKYIDSKYGLSLPYPTSNYQTNKMPLNSSNAIVFSGLFDKEYTIPVKEYNAYLSQADFLLIISLYCKKYGLPDNYFNTIQSMALSGGYELTHACFYYQIAQNNGCINETAEIKELKKQIFDSLYVFANQPGKTMYDVDIEAFAMLIFGGFKPEAEWVNAIIEHQNPDGGWDPNEREKASHPHTAAIALWVMSDYLNRLKPKDDAPFKKLSEAQQFASIYLNAWTTSENLNVSVADLFPSLVGGGKKADYSGYGMNFIKMYKYFDKKFQNNSPLPSINSALSNDDSLAYFLFYLDRTDYHGHIIDVKLLNVLLDSGKCQLNESNMLKYLVLKKVLSGYEYKSAIGKELPKVTGTPAANSWEGVLKEFLKSPPLF